MSTVVTAWQSIKLGDVIKLEYGKPLPDSKRKSNGAYPVYGANGAKDRTDEYYCANESIIVGRKGSAGEITLTEQKFWPLDVTYFIKLNDKKYNLNFIYYLLSSLELKKLAKGVKPGINRNEVYSINVLIPPLHEQKRIAFLLDSAFASITKAQEDAEKNLLNSRKIFELYLQGIFAARYNGWEETKLGEFICLEYGKPLPNTKRKPDGIYPVYGANGEKDRTDEYYHDKKSIIVGRKGSAGEINFTEKKFWPLDVTYFVKIDDKKSNLNFIYYLLNSINLKKLAKGVKPGINRNEVYSINIRMPNLPEQQCIVTILDSLSAETKKLETVYQKKLNSLEELKKSILQKAFSGELI